MDQLLFEVQPCLLHNYIALIGIKENISKTFALTRMTNVKCLITIKIPVPYSDFCGPRCDR